MGRMIKVILGLQKLSKSEGAQPDRGKKERKSVNGAGEKVCKREIREMKCQVPLAFDSTSHSKQAPVPLHCVAGTLVQTKQAPKSTSNLNL